MCSLERRGHAHWDRERLHLDLGDSATRERVGADQIAYYQARAPWYDDVYTSTGDYDRGPELNGEWQADLAAIDQALCRVPLHGDCVELGAGTGYWTEKIVERVERLWALDAVPEVLQIARARVGMLSTRVEFEVVDLWQWQPGRVWDCALACFFIEHVPDEVLPGMLSTLHDALRPGGGVFIAEGASYEAEPQIETRAIGSRDYQVVERRRTADEFSEVFDQAGFSIEVASSGRVVYLTATRDSRD
jgi:SAM-dependent methyltransferase